MFLNTSKVLPTQKWKQKCIVKQKLTSGQLWVI